MNAMKNHFWTAETQTHTVCAGSVVCVERLGFRGYDLIPGGGP